MPRQDLLQVRAGTAAEWTSANPTLAVGEPGLETDTGKFKFGPGAWNSLSYGGGGGTGFESHTLTNSVVINGADWDVQFGVNSDGDRVDNFSAYAETFATLLAFVQAQLGTADASVSVGYDGATPVVEISLPVGGELRIPNLPAGTSASILYLDGNVIKVGAAPAGAWGGLTGTLSDQTDLQAALDAKADSVLTYYTKSASYELDTADVTDAEDGKRLNFNMDVASANTFTIPQDSEHDFPIGTVILVDWVGAGQPTITPGTGTTFQGGRYKLSEQYAGCSCKKVAANTWRIQGSLTS